MSMTKTPYATLLSNGRYSLLLTAAGTGCSLWDELALTRWAADPVEDVEGLHLYLRDLDDGAFWSLGHQPVPGPADSYEARLSPGRAVIQREERGISARLEVCLAPDEDAELRRLTLRNRSDRPRRIEVTGCLEVVLHHPAADAAHPGFSKLFVQTEVEDGTLLARRRPRSPDESFPWLAHALLEPGAVEWETDRARFLGRRRTPAAPAALTSEGPLSGNVGNVLDPVLALRRVLELAPGAEASLTLALGVGADRAEALELVARLRTPGVWERAWSAGVEALAPAAHRALVARFLATAERMASGLHGPEPVYQAAGDDPAPELPAPDGSDLQFWNGIGGFNPDGREYRMEIRPGEGGPPQPWINVLANEGFGALVSESGAGYTWARNSRENRLTPWLNDPVTDPHGEALYLRDEESRRFWSPTPGPAPAPVPCRVCHGLGYSVWELDAEGLTQELTLFVARRDPVKLARLRLTNPGAAPRRLSLFAYQRPVLGVQPGDTAPRIRTEYDPETQALVARNTENGDFADGLVFAAALAPEGVPVRYSADRAAFLGRFGSPTRPAALLHAAALDDRAGTDGEPCLALQFPLVIPPGATVECGFLLGEVTDPAAVAELCGRYRAPGAVDAALAEVRAYWEGLVSGVQVQTPSPALDLMLNAWLPYQTLACRLWGRSAFYQSGGAFGFRDQLQDAASLVHLRPDLTRAQILLNAAHQFREGDVLHWWHPPRSRGIRTRFADDLVWLPLLTAYYIQVTGDRGLLDESAPFLNARPLAEGEDETFLLPEPSGETADVYTHCCRALDRALTRGVHGLPLMGTGDWNDGMNRVGRLGKGESVWMGFFLYRTLGDFLPLCEARGDAERAARYGDYREALRQALETEGWDGAWYRRAWYDNGAPLGSAASDECRIDALAQAWAVISGAAPPDRAGSALDQVEAQLVDQEAGLVRLLAPPFDRTPHDPGYIKGYVAGVRENGGQYTHAALWVVKALAELGRRDRAEAILDLLNPVNHARTPEEVARYQVEPYVVAADVYGVAPHLGRGGWTWYTGSAGWMYRVALESLLGLDLQDGRTLRLCPRIPDRWPGFDLDYRVPGEETRYLIRVGNPHRNAEAVVAATLDGTPVTVEDGAALIPLARDGLAHRVELTLGPGPGSVL